jgi:hypothetical protein
MACTPVHERIFKSYCESSTIYAISPSTRFRLPKSQAVAPARAELRNVSGPHDLRDGQEAAAEIKNQAFSYP